MPFWVYVIIGAVVAFAYIQISKVVLEKKKSKSEMNNDNHKSEMK